MYNIDQIKSVHGELTHVEHEFTQIRRRLFNRCVDLLKVMYDENPDYLKFTNEDYIKIDPYGTGGSIYVTKIKYNKNKYTFIIDGYNVAAETKQQFKLDNLNIYNVVNLTEAAYKIFIKRLSNQTFDK